MTSLQNGIDGAQRIVRGGPARLFSAGRLEGAGIVHYLSRMSSITLGGSGATRHPLLRAFADSVNATSGADALQVNLVEDIGSAQWTKFIVLATNAALTCLTRMPAGAVYRDPDLLALAEIMIAEVMAVGWVKAAVFARTQARNTLALLREAFAGAVCVNAPRPDGEPSAGTGRG